MLSQKKKVALDKVIYMITLITLSIIAGIYFGSNAIAICSMIFGFLIIAINRKEYDLWGIVAVALVISTVMTIIICQGEFLRFGSPYYIGGSDDLDFEQFSKLCIYEGRFTPVQVYRGFYWYNSVGYLWVLSWIMRLANLVGGYHTFVGRIFNVYILLQIGLLAVRYYRLHNKDCSKLKQLFLLVTIFPNAIYITGHVFRDTLAVCLVFYCFIKFDLFSFVKNESNGIKRKKYIFDIIKILLAAGLAVFIRTQSLLLIIFSFGITYILNKRATARRVFLYLIIGFVFVVTVMKPILSMFDLYTSYYYDYMANKPSIGFSSVIWKLPLIPFGFFVRILYGLASPFPNGVLEIWYLFEDPLVFINVFISIGTLFQILCLPYIFFRSKKRSSSYYMFILTFLMVVLTTFTFRHFLYVYPFMWIEMVGQRTYTSNYRKVIFFIGMAEIVVILSVLYFLLI